MRRCLSRCACVVVVLVGLPAVAATLLVPAFEDSEPVVSNDGAVQLAWSGERGEYEVELRHEDRARVVYRGRMPSAHVSGLADGEYALRVRARTPNASWTPWSAPKTVTVEHHPMPMVFTLMSLGLLTFLATAVVVVRSSRRAS